MDFAIQMLNNTLSKQHTQKINTTVPLMEKSLYLTPFSSVITETVEKKQTQEEEDIEKHNRNM